MTEVMSRQSAKGLGLKTYYSKTPCSAGHDCARYVRSNICLECGVLRGRKFYKDCNVNGHVPQHRCHIRKLAKEAGQLTYFTGRFCKNGHMAARRVKTNRCTSCEKVWHKEWERGAEVSGKLWTTRGLPAPTRPMPESCESCGKIQGRRLALDHDHETQEFRGWLCNACNRGIGYLGDDLKGIMNAMLYLQKNNHGEIH